MGPGLQGWTTCRFLVPPLGAWGVQDAEATVLWTESSVGLHRGQGWTRAGGTPLGAGTNPKGYPLGAIHSREASRGSMVVYPPCSLEESSPDGPPYRGSL